MGQTIFLVVWVMFAFIILIAIFTRKGRNLGIKFQYGATVIEDLGEVGQTRIRLGTQKVTLLKCRDKVSDFYVLETRTVAGPGVQYTYVKVDEAMHIKLKSLMTFKADDTGITLQK